jgi:DNA-binding transcriptional ArsR family regulator
MSSTPSDPDPVTASAPSVSRLQITDAQTMRALAHPIRVALLELLAIESTLTATEAGELLGESPAACSFHLRQLARYGFVEEALGGAGRARPWRRVPEAFSLSTVQEDPETAVAAGALARLYRNRQFERLQQYLETTSSYPQEWQEAATSTASRIWMTASELQVFAEELTTLLIEKLRERRDDPALRPPGAVPVEILMHAFPTRPPTEEDPS